MPRGNVIELDRYRWLAGLGAAPAIDPSWRSAEELAAAQDSLKKVILAGDKAIYGAIQDAPWYLFETDFVKVVRGRLDDYSAQWELFKKNLWEAANRGTIDGVPVSRTQLVALLKLVQKQVQLVTDQVELLKSRAGARLLASGAGAVFQSIFKRLNDLSALIGRLIDALLAAGGAAVTTLEWLPWIVLGAIALPFIFRTTAAYRKGGTDAALETAAGQIESGRERAVRGVKSVARRFAGSSGRRRRSR